MDLLMFAGAEHYTVSSFILEAQRMGVSKRIPKNNIPEIIPGVSRLFIAHKDAKVNAKRIDELVHAIQAIILVESDYDFAPLYVDKLGESALPIRTALDFIKAVDIQQYQRLISTFEVTFSPAVFGYCYITGIQYVLAADEDENDIPVEVITSGVEPVHIKKLESPQ